MMAAVFKFVSSDQTGPKRLQTSKACDYCRRRKKRCTHGENANGQPVSTPVGRDNTALVNQQSAIDNQTSVPDEPRLVEAPQIVDRQLTGGVSQLHDPDEEVGNNSSTTRNARFIGDLNPEGIFLAATSPDATRGASLDDSIGVWLNSSLNHGSQKTSQVLQSPSNLFYRSGSLIQKVLIPLLEQECLSTMPPPDGFQALSQIYFDKVFPIFPVVNQSTIQSSQISKPDSTILQQGICLAASKNQAAGPYLILGDASLSCREFGEKISGAMRMTIEMGLVKNKIVLIQALALLSQFSDDPPGEDLSSQFCMRAVHQVQSLGLHVKGQEEHADQGNTTLLCCIWAMDRMNAAFNGRPVSMHERDLRKDLDQCFQHQQPSFRLFLEVITLLDKVIELYRPVAVSGDTPVLSWDFPAFEDMVLKCGSSHIGTTALASIEVLYHAVAILSCRTKLWVDPGRSSTAFLRQSLSTSILSSTFSRAPQDQLVLFPFVPYAMSLSMSISYREIRYGKLPAHRARSRGHFQTLCDALSALEGVFWSAAATAEMGRKLLKEMDRVFSTVSTSETMRSHQPHTRSNSHTRANSQHPGPGSTSQSAVMTNADTQHSDISMQDFDPSIFDSITDIDLFGMFDPAFDLDGFDACLEGNLNPGFPSGLQ
ncbi:hypothetical protein ONS95_007847 [Cadophora gregata]|uniref:uncharacterized protein n=1 Tax=Cadophora gregata TaxID=51156 RepID=UPI0026DC3CE9|nr:uncharacterized protein ONS95_007847 [Cadophora gregata]KAK0118980.1 hypothetical protein ONS96_012053 [Cadophora gregata f. sp. sojae]KAK0126233.1 hypothetical protein ONS95_007847 [Cadophora gregata]